MSGDRPTSRETGRGAPRAGSAAAGDPAGAGGRPPAVSGEGVVPLIEVCPACATPVSGHKCKVYCPNPQCALYRCIIENCAGD